MIYKPDKIASRPIIATSEGGTEGSPYQLPNGVVTTFDLGSGSIWANMPSAPEANDTVTVKNARGKYFLTTEDHVLTINANGNELEVPGLNDTGSLIQPTSSFSTSHPRFAARWIFVPGDPHGTWVIDNDYDSGSAVTHIAGDYTIHPSEMVFAKTTSGPVTITIPEGFPDDSYIFASKTSDDQNLLWVQASGVEQIVSPQSYLRQPVTQYAILDQAETVTWIKVGSIWQPVNANYDEYVELFYLPTVPVDITPVQSLLPIVLHPSWNQSLLFESNQDGLLTMSADVQGEIPVVVDIQTELEHILTSNNADVDVEIVPVVSAGGAESIMLPIRTSFAHSRSGTFGDNRNSTSLALMSAGSSIGFYAREIDSSAGSSDIVKLLISIEV